MNSLKNESSSALRKKALLYKKGQRYFWIFLLLLVTEIAIAYFHFNKFVRGFIGDVLVIPLLYSLLKIFLKIPPKKLLYATVTFAFLVEMLQLLPLVKVLNLENTLWEILLGSHFDLMDLFAYVLGIIPVLIIEKHSSYENP
ncbi:MAG: DUF2809 domain-containing protein [Flavobacteriaceae bacterium]